MFPKSKRAPAAVIARARRVAPKRGLYFLVRFVPQHTQPRQTSFAVTAGFRSTAVARNRAKRRAREALKAVAPLCRGDIAVVVSVSAAALDAPHPHLVKELRRLLADAGCLGATVAEYPR
jgi:ribonuclease P protein component